MISIEITRTFFFIFIFPVNVNAANESVNGEGAVVPVDSIAGASVGLGPLAIAPPANIWWLDGW